MPGAHHAHDRTNRRRQDRILYCGRCGVSYLWTAEEQAEERTGPADAPESGAGRRRPLYCAGCRRLMPPPGRERGLVKWYNRRKRFGFITRKDQPDLFVHGSSIADHRPLAPEELVEFAVDESDRGLAAADVVRLTLHPRAPSEAG